MARTRENWYRREGAELARTLLTVGPDAPTLCAGWRSRHLAAHLALRDHEPWRTLPVAGIGDRTVQRVGDEATDEAAYAGLVASFAAGPGGLNPMRLAGDAAELIEYVIHHEDLRRAGPAPAAPRLLPEDMADAVRRRLGTMAPLLTRSWPVGVVLRLPDGRGRRVHAGEHSVLITGDPVELALYVFGRRTAADVVVTGSRQALAALNGM